MLKQFGAIYLILGTCVAAGLLGLPIVTAENSFYLTIIMVTCAWILMTLGAWCLLQVTLWFPKNTHLITQSEQLLGKPMKALTWLFYLVLLYSLLCTYLAGTSDIMQALLRKAHLSLPRWACVIFSSFALGSIVLHGMQSVDRMNRFFMSIKLIILIVLIITLIPHAQHFDLNTGDYQWRAHSWLVIICAFGYAIILPSIRDYIGCDKKQLTRILFIGSTLPIILYLIWIAIIQGAIPRSGHDGLIAMNHSADTNSLLMHQIVQLTHHPVIQSFSVIFISVCCITGLLGVGIALFDFLADGLLYPKQGKHKYLLISLTFLPPTLIIMIDPSLFIKALSYAGFCCLYILVFLPITCFFVGKRKGHQAKTPPH